MVDVIIMERNTEVAELKAENALLLEDKKRLDWYEEMILSGSEDFCIAIGFGNEIVIQSYGSVYIGDNLREAMDKTRRGDTQ